MALAFFVQQDFFAAVGVQDFVFATLVALAFFVQQDFFAAVDLERCFFSVFETVVAVAVLDFEQDFFVFVDVLVVVFPE